LRGGDPSPARGTEGIAGKVPAARTRSGTSPRYSPCPAKTTTVRVPAMSLEIHSRAMPGNLRARAISKNGSAGALHAPSESVMNARARAERPVSLRQPRLSRV